jgi:hypothetical protein
MKRVIFSILGGILLPIIFVLLGASIAGLFSEYNLQTMQVKGQASPGIILAPIAIPFWIYDYIRFYNYFGFRSFFDTFWFRVTLTIGFNFLLYSGLMYLFFWYFGFFKRKESGNYQDPPLPPQF